MESYKRDFIAFLQDAGVLKFGDFTAKSGRKNPYFINAALRNSVIKEIEKWKATRENLFSSWKVLAC